ncbi:hypothetical protein ACOKM3_02210 [Streptomyces sp. BH106]|uniref:hypothetical protein n=1 Tax=Streptomyces sp. BH106 TaxID=3410409 RepID=UPI003CF64204
MRHRPFFRWVATLGVVLVAWAALAHALSPGYPDTRMIELTVIDEKPDGTCTVRWDDPFTDWGTPREAAYRCDPDRDELFKAPQWDEETGYGVEDGFLYEEGPDKGELQPSDLDPAEEKDPYALSDALVAIGLPLLAAGLVGGNIRAASRVSGVRPRLVARAQRLYETADLAATDYARAVDAVRDAWAALSRERIDAELARMPVTRLDAPSAARVLDASGVRTVGDTLDAGVLGLGHMGVDRPTAERAVAAARRVRDDIEATVAVRLDPDDHGPRTVALLVALRVLLEAGPEARHTAMTGKELAQKLEPLLAATGPATGYRHMLTTGSEARARSRAAVADLRALVDTAERDRLPHAFAQTSVDLLRAPDEGARAGIAARTDFENRTAKYFGLLATIVEPR